MALALQASKQNLGSNPSRGTKNLSVQTNKKLLYFQYEKYNDC